MDELLTALHHTSLALSFINGVFSQRIRLFLNLPFSLVMNRPVPILGHVRAYEVVGVRGAYRHAELGLHI